MCSRARRLSKGRKLQLDRSSFAVGLIDGLKQRDDAAAVFAGDQRGPIVEDRPEEVLDLERVVVVDGVDLVESRAVFGLEAGEVVFFAGDGPEVVESAVRRSPTSRR